MSSDKRTFEDSTSKGHKIDSQGTVEEPAENGVSIDKKSRRESPQPVITVSR